MFGGPTRELFVDDISYEGRFGGPPVGVTIDGKVYKAQLAGPPPDVDVRPLQNREYDLDSPKPPSEEAESTPRLDSQSCDRSQRVESNRDQAQDDNFRQEKISHDDERWQGSESPPYSQEERVPRLPEIPDEPLFPVSCRLLHSHNQSGENLNARRAERSRSQLSIFSGTYKKLRKLDFSLGFF